MAPQKTSRTRVAGYARSSAPHGDTKGQVRCKVRWSSNQGPGVQGSSGTYRKAIGNPYRKAIGNPHGFALILAHVVLELKSLLLHIDRCH